MDQTKTIRSAISTLAVAAIATAQNSKKQADNTSQEVEIALRSGRDDGDDRHLCLPGGRGDASVNLRGPAGLHTLSLRAQPPGLTT